jgi:uncharacterized protein YbaR (Trm112 family)
VFIELTDHLRCPAPHPESYLVLLPDRIEQRRVLAGTLGCPSCGRVVQIRDGIADFGGDPPAVEPTVLSAAALATLLGVQGPGGYLALMGAAARLWPELSELLPGIHLVLLNPDPIPAEVEGASVLRAGHSPLKSRSMRGVAAARDHGRDPGWAEAAVEAVLPGNRAVLEGPTSVPPGLEVLGEAAGVWVGRRR